MDNMHARMRVPEREQSQQQQPTAAAPVDEPNRYVPSRPTVEPRKKQKQRLPKWVLLIVALAVVLALAFTAWKLFFNGAGADGIDHSKYQALFLSNGTITNNVYFGKLERTSDGYYKLTDAFYIKAAQASSDSKATASNDLTLAKLGDTEIYGPQDTVIIPREQVLYYQNMKDDSKIVAAITKYHADKK